MKLFRLFIENKALSEKLWLSLKNNSTKILSTLIKTDFVISLVSAYTYLKELVVEQK